MDRPTRPYEHESLELLELGVTLDRLLREATNRDIPRADVARKVEGVLRRFGFQARVMA